MVRRWFAMIAAAALFVSMQAGRAEAVGCRIGCGVAEQTCGYNVKLNGVGCERTCDEAYDPMDPEADEDFKICRTACKVAIAVGKTDCQTAGDACGLACTNAALPSCANICGTDLFYCAAPILQLGQSTFSANQTNGLSAPLLAQGAAGAIALDLCYTTPLTGFNDCMANLACNSICGNGIIEAGETCDDTGTASGDGCSHVCQIEDADGDGIFDDGSGNLVPADSPCPDGVVAGCDDNCQTVANPGQEDGDGDLVGDACDMNCSGTSSGNTISGGVYANSVAPFNGLPDSAVAACKTGTTCCSYTTTDGSGLYSFSDLDDGTYDVTASSPGNYLPGPPPSPIVMSGGSVVPNVDIVMTGPQPIPGIVTITNSFTDDGIVFIAPSSDMTLTIDACVGATVTWSVSQNGPPLMSGNMTEAPPGHFEVVIIGLNALLNPQLPSVHFEITVSGCGGPPDGSYPFDAYIDPSGFTTYVGGDGAPGTTVTLYNGPSIFGPWTVVPNGSVIMSPSNRVNPDLSDASGHFGWDVMAGYYKVIATKSGCTVESYAMTIPPEVTDLNLELDCPCIAPPRTDCLAAAKGKMTIKDSDDDTKDSFQWKWTGGEDTSYAALGLPLVSTSYDVCVYTGGNGLSLMELPVLAGWEASGTTGYKYGDKLGINDGVGKVQMKSGTGGTAKIQVKGKGERLPDPTLGTLPVPIIVQLQPSDLGPCFESEFTTDAIDENSAGALKVKFP